MKLVSNLKLKLFDIEGTHPEHYQGPQGGQSQIQASSCGGQSQIQGSSIGKAFFQDSSIGQAFFINFN